MMIMIHDESLTMLNCTELYQNSSEHSSKMSSSMLQNSTVYMSHFDTIIIFFADKIGTIMGDKNFPATQKSESADL
ncbi:hypothetical protein WN944_020249 [Citrus x changshan-huyou]|uniref:Uncharacterized protein n=1 Tax=Citrus x changshan-huyou TaxID=2935761 RepID=A0AAP0M1J0_9ROSI